MMYSNKNCYYIKWCNRLSQLQMLCKCVCCLFVFLALQPTVAVFSQPGSGLQPPRFRGFLITHNDAPQSVGLLWMRDQSVVETSTWQHTTLTTDKHPCPGWDSNPQFQRASGRRPTPQTARPLGSAPQLCSRTIFYGLLCNMFPL